jgi:hypothetical protein
VPPARTDFQLPGRRLIGNKHRSNPESVGGIALGPDVQFARQTMCPANSTDDDSVCHASASRP